MKQHHGLQKLHKAGGLLQKPIVLALSIFFVGIGLFFGMYAVIQDDFFRVTAEHEMEMMHIVEDLGSEVVDAKLASYKNNCIDLLKYIETESASFDADDYAAFLQELLLPADGFNLAYLYGDTLICRDDAFRDGLEALNLSSAIAPGGCRVFNPYFDDAGNFVLTVAAAAETSSGILIMQYDAFCISNWLKSIADLLDFGTAYIIDSEGYNIATAREENFDWITTRYNAQHYAEQDPTEENVSIAILEKRVLDGETGNGTYEWEGSTSHVAFGPLTEVSWGYFVGFYETQFAIYAQNVAAISGRSAILLLLIFGVFVGCIVILLFRSLAREQKYSRLDALTGVRNKRAWQDAVHGLDGEIHTGAAEFAIVVCDINALKQINDTMGHEYGDDLIMRAGRYICMIFSHSAVYRVGGDEFTVILQGEDLLNCEKLVDAFDAELAGYTGDGPTTLPLSIALGISHYQAGDTASDVFHRADNAMYRKKAAMKAKS